MKRPVNESATADFLKAALCGDLGALRTAQAAGAAVNRSDKKGNTALILAGARGDVPMLAFLFAHGAEARAENDNGDNALMQAVAGGHEAAAVFCLTQDFNMAAKNGAGQTAFGLAARGDMVAVIDAMQAKGADVNAPDEQGRTPLMHAVSSGSLRALEKILSLDGVEIEKRDGEGHTALMLACIGSRREAAVMLLKAGARVDVADDRGRDVMFYASQWGLEDEVRHAFRAYDITQITEGARREVKVLSPLKIRRRV